MAKLNVVSTPIDFFNMIAGGLRFGTLVELWGPNQSGKTVTAYQTAGLFQREYTDGEVVLLDTESGYDEIRCKHAFGWDLSRVTLLHCRDLESGFVQITQLVEKATHPLLILWDSLAAAPTAGDLANVVSPKEAKKGKGDKDGKETPTMFSGGIQARGRVIKHYLRNIMGIIFQKPVIILLPNQVFVDINNHGAIVSGEGSALKHDIHYSFRFDLRKQSLEMDAAGLVDHVISDVTLTKSKFSPRFDKRPIYINVARGGIVDQNISFLLTCEQLGFLNNDKGWWTVMHPDFKEVRCRWSDIIQNMGTVLPPLRNAVTRYILENHFLVKILYEQLGWQDKIDSAFGSTVATPAQPKGKTTVKEVAAKTVKKTKKKAKASKKKGGKK